MLLAATDSSGNIIAGRFNNLIRTVDSAGIIRMIAGDDFHSKRPSEAKWGTLGLSQPDNSYQRNRAPPRFVERPCYAYSGTPDR
jgi:hypothetical protein